MTKEALSVLHVSHPLRGVPGEGLLILHQGKLVCSLHRLSSISSTPQFQLIPTGSSCILYFQYNHVHVVVSHHPTGSHHE